jgi:hypothetical protein
MTKSNNPFGNPFRIPEKTTPRTEFFGLRGPREACEDTVCEKSCDEYRNTRNWSKYRECKINCLNNPANHNAIRDCCYQGCGKNRWCLRACDARLVYGGKPVRRGMESFGLRGPREACEDTVCEKPCDEYRRTRNWTNYKNCKINCLNNPDNHDAIQNCCYQGCGQNKECLEACNTKLVYGGETM